MATTWIKSGRCLDVIVPFTIDNLELAKYNGSGFMLMALQQALQQAPLWSQLGYDVACSSGPTHHGGQGQETSILSVRLQPMARTTISKAPAARLLKGVPWIDILPPQGIEALSMRELELRINLTTTNLVGSFRRICEPTKHMVELNLSVDSQGIPLWPDMKLGYVDDTRKQANMFDTAILIELLDAALRGCIHSRPTSLAAGVSISSRSPTRDCSLSALAPAVWNPEYLRDVAERACYIPVMSETIRNYLVRTTSMKLKSLGKAISRKDSSQWWDNVQIQFWRVLTTGVSQENAAAALLPVHPIAPTDSMIDLLEHTHEYPDVRIHSPNPDVKNGTDNCSDLLHGRKKTRTDTANDDIRQSFFMWAGQSPDT